MFDPHQWLAERKSAARVADAADVAAIDANFKNSQSHEPPATTATTATNAERNPSVHLREWHSRLAKLAPDAPPIGFSRERWRELVEDAWWLARHHGDKVAAMGWGASDLFGLDLSLDGWGGLADRLFGARRVTFSDRIAHWQQSSDEGWLWRSTLCAMVPIWEAHCSAVAALYVGLNPSSRDGGLNGLVVL